MKLFAPAKVNLHLRILGRRPDGFHEIETLMAPISLGDEVEVEVGEGDDIAVECDDQGVPLGEENLVVRAARVFARETGRTFSARIKITKRVPMGAGLGGGSSDAAAVLLALNKIFVTELSETRLEEFAAMLGSDIPFFIRKVPALCRGRGERMEPAPLVESLRLLLIKPPFGVETPWAYRQWKDCSSRAEEQTLGWVPVVNDLEPPVFEKFLLLPAIKEWLRAQPEVRVAAMSGSGSTMFAVLQGEEPSDLEQRAREQFGTTMWTTICRTL